MVAIHIITVGRDKKRWVTEQIEHYRKLLSKYARLEITSVPEDKYGSSADIPKSLAREAKITKSRLKGGYLVALDIEGRLFGTEAFAGELRQLQAGGVSRFDFIIGGPYGLDDSLKNKADLRLSLSPLTMSHQIVRLVLLEQLYRVFNINAEGSYHK